MMHSESHRKTAVFAGNRVTRYQGIETVSKILYNGGIVKHMKKANKRYKDRLFRRVFSTREELLVLYNAVNGSS